MLRCTMILAVIFAELAFLARGNTWADTLDFGFLSARNGADPWSDASSWSPFQRLPQSGDDANLLIQPGQNVSTQTVLYDLTTTSPAALNDVRWDATAPVSSVTMNQPGGAFQAATETIGVNGSAVYNQSGGINTVTSALYLGANAGSQGSYSLTDGSFAPAGAYVGYSGSGTLAQSGGTISTRSVILGYHPPGMAPAGTGAYLLTGGAITSGALAVGNFGGTGSVIQSGNSSVAITGGGNVGIGARGSYQISSGTLTAGLLGDLGGSFTQSGGRVTVAKVLIGQSNGNPPVVSLSGGQLFVTGGATGGPQISGGSLHQSASNYLEIDGGQLALSQGAVVNLDQGRLGLKGSFSARDPGTQFTSSGIFEFGIPSQPSASFGVSAQAVVRLPDGLEIADDAEPALVNAQVSDGGQLTIGNLSIASTSPGKPGHTGTLRIAASGSVMQTGAAPTLTIGSQPADKGKLEIGADGVFRSGLGAIANGPGGTILVIGGRFVANGPVTNDGQINIMSGVGDFISFPLTGAGTLSVGAAFDPAEAGIESFTQTTVSVGPGALLRLDTHPSPALSLTRSLTFPTQAGYGYGRLDLTDNNLMIHYAGSASPDRDVRKWISMGYTGGTWNGQGIVSSIAPTSGHTLGYADGAAGVVSGLSAGDELIEYTLPGDANLDGKVDFSDFTLMAAHFDKTGAGWIGGDFNYDGVTDFADFNLLAANFAQTLTSAEAADVLAFGRSLASDPAEQAGVEAFERTFAVPEPSALLSLSIAAVCLRLRIRCRA